MQCRIREQSRTSGVRAATADLIIVALVVLLAVFGLCVFVLGPPRALSPVRATAMPTPPVAQPVLLTGDFAQDMANRFYDVVTGAPVSGGQVAVPFLDEAILRTMQAELLAFVREHAPEDLDTERQIDLIGGMDRYARRWFQAQPFETPARNQLYTAWPDNFKTLQWLVYTALQAPPLTAEEGRELTAQRQWMGNQVNSLPEQQGFTRAQALAQLDEMFADPYCAALARPMTTNQWEAFQAKVRASKTPDNIIFVSNRVANAAQEVRFPNDQPLDLPFEDQVYRRSHHGDGIIELGFRSNAAHRGNQIWVSESKQAIDVVTQQIVPHERRPEKTEDPSPQASEPSGGGHVAYESKDGGQIVAINGAKLARIYAKDWIDVDDMSTDQVRQIIGAKPTEVIFIAERNDALRQTNPSSPAQFRADMDQQGAGSRMFVAVLTAEGRLSVVQIIDVNGNGASVHVRTRPEDARPK